MWILSAETPVVSHLPECCHWFPGARGQSSESNRVFACQITVIQPMREAIPRRCGQSSFLIHREGDGSPFQAP